MKKIFLALAIGAVLIGATTVAYGASLFQTPAEIAADLTGKTVEQATELRQNGTSYGAQAAQAGKLDEFKQERLEQYKLSLDQAVQEKRMTQEQADTLYNNMKTRMETCTGTGTGCQSGGGNGQRGFGLGNGNGKGSGVNCGRLAPAQ